MENFEKENVMKIERKNETRNKILLFVIGVLVGAVISTAAFFVYTQTLDTSTSSGNSMQMPGGGGTPPEMPSGDNSGNNQSGTPPEMPSNSGNNSSSQNSSN